MRCIAGNEAEAWLTERLRAAEDDVVLASVLLEEAKRDGINEKSLRRAKHRLGVGSTKAESGWSWTLEP